MMKVNENILARIYSFDLQFGGGKRTSFYRKLFGFQSKSTRQDKEGREKVYENFYPGLLTPLPHLKLGKSVIAVPKKAEKKVDGFFKDSKWTPIDLYSFDGILPQKDRLEAMRSALERIKITPEESLRSEIDSLLSIESKGALSSEDNQRIKRVLKNCEELMRYDWTDNSQFSKELKEEIRTLEKQIE